MALIVRWGSLISSIRYKIRRDGRAIRIRMIAGRTVQMISISWESRTSLSVSFAVTMATII